MFVLVFIATRATPWSTLNLTSSPVYGSTRSTTGFIDSLTGSTADSAATSLMDSVTGPLTGFAAGSAADSLTSPMADSAATSLTASATGPLTGFAAGSPADSPTGSTTGLPAASGACEVPEVVPRQRPIQQGSSWNG